MPSETRPTWGREPEGPWGVLDWLPDALTIQDQSATIVQATRAVSPIFGYTVSELVGQPFSRLIDASKVEPTSVETVLRSGLAGEQQNVEWYGVRRGGESFPADVSIVRCVYRSQPMTVAVIRDVTERKRVAEMLRLSQRMEAVGRLAGGIAHDFNNLLTIIRSHTGLLLREAERAGRVNEEANHIEHAARQAMALTQQLLAFSRQQVLQYQSVDVNGVVRETSNMVRRLIGEDIEFRLVLDPSAGRVIADPHQLNQVLLNLAVNARQAMPSGGRLILRTSSAELSVDEARRYPYPVEPGSYSLISVTDTGHGMTKETLEHIFDPFFTTRGAEHGVGLGLATVYGIVKQSGGYIWAESTPGEGTTFRLFLRRADPGMEHGASPRPHSAGKASADETVLVVEDDEFVRRAIRAILQDGGYSVVEAPDGEAALGILNGPHSIALILTDLVMPRLTGRQLIRLLPPQDRPRVLYMSGYTDTVQIRQDESPLDAQFIAKPFDVDELLEKVREVLDSPR